MKRGISGSCVGVNQDLFAGDRLRTDPAGSLAYCLFAKTSDGGPQIGAAVRIDLSQEPAAEEVAFLLIRRRRQRH